jgi:hypothetical protein
MSELVITGDQTPEESNEELKYKATEEDEEKFFLMYHMHVQPSETECMNPDYRKWLIARFIGQKQMEREMMERQRLMGQIGGNFKV